MRRRQRKNTAGRSRRRRVSHAAADQVTVCWGLDFYWVPLYVHIGYIQLIICVLSTDLGKILFAPHLAECNNYVSHHIQYKSEENVKIILKAVLEIAVTPKSIPLTFRVLMSYIYMEHPFLMFLDHTQRRTTVGRTPLDE